MFAIFRKILIKYLVLYYRNNEQSHKCIKLIKKYLKNEKNNLFIWKTLFEQYFLLGSIKKIRKIIKKNSDNHCINLVSTRYINQYKIPKDFLERQNLLYKYQFFKHCTIENIIINEAKKYDFFDYDGNFCVNFMKFFHKNINYIATNTILYIVDDLTLRGSELYLLNIAQEAHKNGLKIKIFVRVNYNDNDLKKILQKKTFLKAEMFIPYYHYSSNNFFGDEFSKKIFLKNINQLINVILDVRPKIVHSRSGGLGEVIFASLYCNVPQVLLQIGAMPQKDGLKNITHYEIYKKILNNNRFYFIFNCVFLKKVWSSYLNIKSQQIEIIYNYKQKIETKYVSNNNDIIAGIFRLDSNKNPYKFLQIAKKMPNYIFYIYGDGKLKKFIQFLITKYHLNDRVFLKNETLEFPHNISLLLHTAYKEGIPNVILEALSRNIPVVAANVGGIKEIESKNITFFNHNDSVDNIIQKIENRMNKNFQAEDLLFFQKQYTIDKFLQKYSEYQ